MGEIVATFSPIVNANCYQYHFDARFPEGEVLQNGEKGMPARKLLAQDASRSSQAWAWASVRSSSARTVW